jgi:hypothetical protein
MIRVSVFALVAAIAAVSLAVPASAAARHSGRPLYDVVPQGQAVVNGTVNSDDPSLTGGGSTGYNQMIYNW